MIQTPITETLPADTTATSGTLSGDLSMLKTMSLDELISRLAHDIITFFISLAVAVAVFYIGKFIIRKIYGFVAGVMIRREVDQSLSTFILSLINIVLYFLLIVTVISLLGINTSSFIALFASAGVAIGMALSGTLQNFAGGVLILLLKPYRIGDYIETQGYAGTVTEIQIFSTIINTPDNKTIMIPNGGLSTGTINNWSREDYRRVEWTVSLAYGDDVATAKEAIMDILLRREEIVKVDIPTHRLKTLNRDIEAEKAAAQSGETGKDQEGQSDKRSVVGRLFGGKIRREKTRLEQLEARRDRDDKTLRAANPGGAPTVALSALADSSINFTVRAWVPAAQYWPVFYAVNEDIYNELPARGLHFPFPQLDVHMDRTDS
ncbi:MAG: mechanosensitive ion channel [Clostridium sp.]|nr:mechanosensitive ion channel [Clostridium sp.]